MSRIQFSLRTILGLTVFVAACAGVAVARPSWLTGLIAIFLVVLVPAFLLALSIQAKDNLRAFLLGAFFTASAPCILYVATFDSESPVSVITVIDAGENEIRREIRVDRLAEGLVESLDEFLFILFFWAMAPFVGIATALLNWFVLPKRRDPH